MELEGLLALVKAGFTKDEIMQMAQPTPVQSDTTPVPVDEPAPTPEPVQTPANEPVPVAVPAPVAVPTQTQPQEQAQPTMTDIMQGIARLTSAIQANAIAQSSIPAGLQNPPSAEDMLAEIIRPTFKERN